MTEVYLARIPAEENKESKKTNASALPLAIKDRIKNTKDVMTRLERIYAYSLLRCVLNNLGISDDALCDGFFFDEKGKPHLRGCEIEFSVSHTDGMAAVAVCKNSAVGVDIEKIDLSKKERVEKLIARFCKNVRTSENKTGISKKYISDLGKNQLQALEALSETPMDGEAAFIEWTVLEAALKHDGTGFERVKSFDNVIKDLKTESAVISADGERYALSVAVEK